MSWSFFVRSLSFVALSTWVTAGTAVVLGLLLVAVASGRVVSVGLARRTQAALPTSDTTYLDPFAVSWMRRRLVGLGIGFGLGALFGGSFVFWTGSDRGSLAVGFIVLASVAGAVLGGSVGSLSAASRQRVAKRFSHSRAISVTDYRPTWIVWAGRLIVGTSTVALAAIWLATPRVELGEFPWPYVTLPAILVVPALVVLLFSEVGGRVVVSRPTRASSVEALSLEDIHRSLIVRDLAHSTVSLGVLSFLAVAPAAIDMIAPQAQFFDNTTTSIVELITAAAVLISIGLSFWPRVPATLANDAKVAVAGHSR